MSAGRQYRLLRELGTGTFGTVYQAEMTGQGGFKKQVALKVLHPIWERDKDAAQRFRDEARLLGQLRQRHIVQVDGLVKVGGRWAVVMEFVPGVDGNVVLKACRKAGEPFPVSAALEVVGAVASALDAAWSAPNEQGEPLRVIHRDIKPSNIRLTEDGDVKVLDFGIARADFDGREAVTHSVRYGSVRYMAPERARKQPDTPAGDVFALGCVFFEFLTGRPLGTVEAEWAQHHEKVHAKVEKLREGLGEHGAEIASLIARMLAFEPERRPLASEIAERARILARQYPGEDLATFAKRFLPMVTRYVPDTSMPLERIVTEGAASAEEVLDRRGVLPPVVLDPARRPVWLGPLIAVSGLAVLLGLLIGGTYVIVGLGGRESGTPVPAKTATVSPPKITEAPTVVPEPVPTEVTPPVVVPVVVPPIEKPPSEPKSSKEDPKKGEPKVVKTEPKVTPVGNPGGTTTTVVAPAVAAPAGRPLRGVKFTAMDATSMSAQCNGAKASGTSSVLVRDPWPGTCKVTATVGGVSVNTSVEITEEQGLTCVVDAGAFQCR